MIGDHEIYDQRRYGYYGIHKLVHRTNPKSIFDGDQDWRATLDRQ
jgi:hypothetical protein